MERKWHRGEALVCSGNLRQVSKRAHLVLHISAPNTAVCLSPESGLTQSTVHAPSMPGTLPPASHLLPQVIFTSTWYVEDYYHPYFRFEKKCTLERLTQGTQCKLQSLHLHTAPSISKSSTLSQPPTDPNKCLWDCVVFLCIHWIGFCNQLQVQDIWVGCCLLLRSGEEFSMIWHHVAKR